MPDKTDNWDAMQEEWKEIISDWNAAKSSSIEFGSITAASLAVQTIDKLFREFRHARNENVALRYMIRHGKSDPFA